MTYLHDEQHRDTTKQITIRISSSRCAGTRTTGRLRYELINEKFHKKVTCMLLQCLGLIVQGSDVVETPDWTTSWYRQLELNNSCTSHLDVTSEYAYAI